ncbi:hypothetical protein FB567DRAFT_593180 [Paraphoma chrysanthemicola]|uniref:Heterokaryon incompatibility domain-containing protein n=1 Tax=Paraphoma chrysanthemicola TaxID=798071 RepID=A0A8K0VXZ2_9PLEO|nr:hypothetical protein FB567DRAFT_593180 [Paraphoma chrysanthemicola]
MSTPCDNAQAQPNDIPKNPYAASVLEGQEDITASNKRPSTSDTSRNAKRPRCSTPATPDPMPSDPHDPHVPDEDDSPFFFPPISFATTAAIPIGREGLRKPTGTAESSATGRMASLKATLIKKKAGSFYRYQHIWGDQVRVLVLKAGARNDPLNGTLLTIGDEKDYQYTALSYNWGDDSVESNINIQNDVKSAPIKSLQSLAESAMASQGPGVKKLLITSNLSDALKHLRQEDQPLLIWIDALCINQSDEVEKKEQRLPLNSNGAGESWHQVSRSTALALNSWSRSPRLFSGKVEMGRTNPRRVWRVLSAPFQNFETSDPRDTINAFVNIAKELDRAMSNKLQLAPEPDFTKDLFEVYRDFLQWVVATAKSLDTICRHWALPERATNMPTTPRLVDLPSYMQLVDHGAFGRGSEVFDGRNAGDSFVGQPGDHHHHASGFGWQHKTPEVEFRKDAEQTQAPQPSCGTPTATRSIVRDMSMLATSRCIGTVSSRNQPFADGVIPKECLQKLGWEYDWHAEQVEDVPEQLWQTLVADCGLNGDYIIHTMQQPIRRVFLHEAL